MVEKLSKSYKAVRFASDVDRSSLSTVLQSPGKLAMQRRSLVQAPKIDLAKTSHAGSASALVSKLHSPKKRSRDNDWRNQDCFVCMLNFGLFCC